MVLKINEIKCSDSLNALNSYNIDYVQIKLDIKRAVIKLTKAKKRYTSDLKNLRQLAENTLFNKFDTMPVATITPHNHLHKHASNSSLNTIKSTSTCSTTNSTLPSTPEYYALNTNKNVSSTLVDDEMQKLNQNFKSTKSDIIVSLLYKTFVPQLKRIESFIYLKKLEIIQNIRANNNNFRHNDKTILSEILRINDLSISEFLEPLSREISALPNNDSNNLKFLNLASIDKKIQNLEILNGKLLEKIQEPSKSTFLHLKTFLNLQKEIIYHLIHFFNKLLLKYEYSIAIDDPNILNYVDYLYLVNGFQSLKIKKDYTSALNLNFLNASQDKLLLSYNERLTIYKFVFNNFFNMEFDQFTTNNIFGNTIYEKEFIYFNFKLSEINNNNNIYLTANDLLNSINSKNLKIPNFYFWNISFESIYKLISICLSVIQDNNNNFLKISKLSNIINFQRQLIYHSGNSQKKLNLNMSEISQFYISDNMYKIFEELNDSNSHPSSKINQVKDFDLLSLNNSKNNQWFLVPSEYLYEVTFKLDSEFINIDDSPTSVNAPIENKKQEIRQLLEQCSSAKAINERKWKKEKIHYFGALEFDGSSLHDLIPVQVLEYEDENDTNNESDICLAAGFTGKLGRFISCEFRSTILYAASANLSPTSSTSFLSSLSNASNIDNNSHRQRVIKEIINTNDEEGLKFIIDEYFNGNASNLKNFKRLFLGETGKDKKVPKSLKIHELTSFEYSKKRRYTTTDIVKQQSYGSNKNACISLYEGIEFKVPQGKISDNFRNFCLLEINWPENFNIHSVHKNNEASLEILESLVNCDYLYDLGIDVFNPFIYSLLSFNVFPKIDDNLYHRDKLKKQKLNNNSENEEDPESTTITSYSFAENDDNDDDNEYNNYEWFGKIMNKKFKLKLGIDARVYRSIMKNQLQLELKKQQQQEHDGTTQMGNQQKCLNGSQGNYYDSSKQRYWNEFDDDPDFNHDDSFYVMLDGGNNIDNGNSNTNFFISEQIVNFFMNFSYSMKSELKKFKKSLMSFKRYKFKYRGSNSSLNLGNKKKRKNKRTNALLPYYVSHSDHNNHYYNSIVNSNIDSRNNSTISRFDDSDSEEDINYFPDIDPRLEKLQNYDIISAFLYFVLSFISLMMISVISILQFLYSDELPMNPATYGVFLFGIIILNCSCLLSLMIYSDRKSTAPIYHTGWLCGVAFIVVLFSIVLVVEIFHL